MNRDDVKTATAEEFAEELKRRGLKPPPPPTEKLYRRINELAATIREQAQRIEVLTALVRDWQTKALRMKKENRLLLRVPQNVAMKNHADLLALAKKCINTALRHARKRDSRRIKRRSARS